MTVNDERGRTLARNADRARGGAGDGSPPPRSVAEL